MTFKKHGQAALEFLMTYGWALLVVLVGLSTLAFYGALSPEKSLPDQCTMFAGVGCEDYIGVLTLDTGLNAFYVSKFTLTNHLGYAMSNMVVQLNIQGVGVSIVDFPVVSAPAITWDTEDCGSIVQPTVPINGILTCGHAVSAATIGGPDIGERVEGQIVLTWTDPQGNQRMRMGDLAVTLEDCTSLGVC